MTSDNTHYVKSVTLLTKEWKSVIKMDKKKKILDIPEKNDKIEAWGVSSVPLVISGDKKEDL